MYKELIRELHDINIRIKLCKLRIEFCNKFKLINDINLYKQELNFLETNRLSCYKNIELIKK